MVVPRGAHRETRLSDVSVLMTYNLAGHQAPRSLKKDKMSSKRYPNPETKNSDQRLTTHKGENNENTVISKKVT